VTVVKIGGSTLDSRDTTIEDIVTIQKRGEQLIVVHGGGGTVTSWLKRQGIETKFVRGERVTDLPTLEVATAVLAGLVNKEIAAAINSRGGSAVGISGVDGSLIMARARNREMGYVGDVAEVNPALLEALLAAGFVPVISPLSMYAVDRPEGESHIINVNGDPIAGEIAVAVKAARLIFLTDTAGVCDAAGTVLWRLSASEAADLMDSGVISGGMIPKINAGLRAFTAGTITRIIDGRQPHALVDEMDGRGSGTLLYKE